MGSQRASSNSEGVLRDINASKGTSRSTEEGPLRVLWVLVGLNGISGDSRSPEEP